MKIPINSGQNFSLLLTSQPVKNIKNASKSFSSFSSQRRGHLPSGQQMDKRSSFLNCSATSYEISPPCLILPAVLSRDTPATPLTSTPPNIFPDCNICPWQQSSSRHKSYSCWFETDGITFRLRTTSPFSVMLSPTRAVLTLFFHHQFDNFPVSSINDFISTSIHPSFNFVQLTIQWNSVFVQFDKAAFRIGGVVPMTCLNLMGDVSINHVTILPPNP